MKWENDYFSIVNYSDFFIGIKKGTILSIRNIKSNKFKWEKKDVYRLYFRDFAISIMIDDNNFERTLKQLERILNADEGI